MFSSNLMHFVAEMLESRGSEEIRSGACKKKLNTQVGLCVIQLGVGKSQP